MKIKGIHIEGSTGSMENSAFIRYLEVKILATLKTRGLISALQFEKASEALRSNRP